MNAFTAWLSYREMICHIPAFASVDKILKGETRTFASYFKYDIIFILFLRFFQNWDIWILVLRNLLLCLLGAKGLIYSLNAWNSF